jgi:hypothetical protein
LNVQISRRKKMYRKYVTAFLMFLVLAIGMPLATATNVEAQTRRYYSRTQHRWVYYKKPGFYRRHRKAVNIGGGALAGAVIGGLLGGKKGVAIGGLAGAGTGALVTHKQRPKHYTRYYYRRP